MVKGQNDIRAVLCDIGGVLIHKERTPELQQWERRFGLEPMSLPLAVWLCNSGLRATLGEVTVDDVWHEIQQKYNLTDTELEVFKYDFSVCDRVDSQFVQFLCDVRKTGKVALLSNAWPDARHIYGNEFGLLQVTNTLILSCEEGLTKPDPRIYNLAAQRLNEPHASIVFIDDYAPNVFAAQACGMKGIVYESREQVITELHVLLYRR